MKTGPNDPCWCDSARKYKKCHKAFDEAPEHQKYQEAQKAYAAIWRDTSERQFDRGDYDWMASQLSPFHVKRVFDVGCGSGHGLLALTRTLSPKLRIVAVDENLACLTIAKETLSSSGQTAQLIARLETVSTPRGFAQIAESFSEPLSRPIALIEADLSTDQYLEKSLIEDGLFDAVTIWLNCRCSSRKNGSPKHREV